MKAQRRDIVNDIVTEMLNHSIVHQKRMLCVNYTQIFKKVIKNKNKKRFLKRKKKYSTWLFFTFIILGTELRIHTIRED